MNPIIPMWALTGHPTTEQLHRELKKFRAGGVEQVMLYPRSGCEYEYMSEEWFRICGDCISFAAENGMKIWLYDEFNWPSGSCGRRVPKLSREYCGKRLSKENGKVSVEYADPETAKFSADLLNPEAVDRFIEMTHEKYAERFSPYFGTTVLGFFSDEPGVQYFAEQDKPPYYNGAFEDYAKAYGRDAKADYLADEEGFYGRWNHLIGMRFQKTFLAKCGEWCESHGLLYTGHTFCDDGVCRSLQSCGNVFSALDHLSLPGVDEIANDLLGKLDDFVFAHVDTMRRRGKKGGMAELFAYGPSSLAYIRRRQMIWYAAAYGVDHFFVAISHLDIRGNRVKKDYFCDFSPASPDFFAGALSLKATAEKAAEYASKTPVAVVAVRFPYRVALEMSRRYMKECEAGKLLRAVVDGLVEQQIPWILIDEDEKTDAAVCFAFTEDGIREENSGREFCCAADAVESLSEIDRPVSVRNLDGTLAEKVLVRCYTDGSYVIVDKNGDAAPLSRCLRLCVKGLQTTVTLPAAGVITDGTAVFTEHGREIPVEGLRVRYDAAGVHRAEFFGAKEYAFTLTEPMALTVSARIDEKVASVLLDGEAVAFDRSSPHLPSSMENLYRTSKPVVLEAGKHMLCTDAEELPHFPAVLLFGDFYEEGSVLSPRGEAFVDGKDFYGCASVCFEADLRAGRESLFLTFEDNRLVSELYANGEKIGACAFAPYRYKIPAALCGHVRFELRFYSGYAPLFGDLDAVHKQHPLSQNGTLRFSVPERLCLRGLRIGGGEL